MLTDVTPDMDAYREEFFGPVGVVYRVADEDEAVEVANDTPFGLGSYVFTTDEAQAARVADKIEAGMVYVNVVLADSPELPFGGVKRSGTSREMGLLAADEFVNKKLIRIGSLRHGRPSAGLGGLPAAGSRTRVADRVDGSRAGPSSTASPAGMPYTGACS